MISSTSNQPSTQTTITHLSLMFKPRLTATIVANKLPVAKEILIGQHQCLGELSFPYVGNE